MNPNTEHLSNLEQPYAFNAVLAIFLEEPADYRKSAMRYTTITINELDNAAGDRA
jgi:hypothetical protein